MELRDLLISSDIDILAVREWKLQTNKTPFTEGYTTICKDQANILGGGLLFFIRTDIVFEKLNSVEKLVWRSFPSISRLLSTLQRVSSKHLNSTYFIQPFTNQARSFFTHSWQPQ